MLPIPFWLSWRYLRFQGKKSFVSLITIISIAGVAVGVMTLMVVMAVMSGFDQELKDKFLGIYGHVVVTSGNVIYDYDNLIRKIEDFPRVEAAAPYIAGQIIIRTRNQALGVNLRGIEPSAEVRVSKLGKYLEAGSINPGPEGIIIGDQLARLYHLHLEDKVILISPMEGLIAGGPGRERAKFTVKGIFKSGMAQYDLELAYVSLAEAQRLFGLEGGITGVSIRVDNVEHAHLVRNQLSSLLPPPYYIRSWMELNKPLFSAIRVEKNLMFIIVTLIIVVASLNIASTLIVTVREKTKAIGIFKALGMPEGTIRNIFALHGMIIGLIGITIGISGGLFLIVNINHVAAFLSARFGIEVFPPDVYYFDQIPARADFRETIVIAICALAISILASLYPAWQASRLEPVQALRYE